jgi:uncharacterized NAD-dependent epimerase/dehydratase family protein
VNARYALEGRRHAVLTEGFLTEPHGKTAHGVIRYRPEQVVAVIDSQYAGKRVCEVVPSLASDAPIVASVREALAYGPRSLLIGFATDGGAVPPKLRAPIVEAIDAGLDVISGLHEVLSDDPALAARAAAKGVELIDVRVPPAKIPLFSGAVYRDKRTKVLAVGSDCAVGKMTAMLEIERAAREAGGKVEFIATGQTGILITGKGIAVDRVISFWLKARARYFIRRTRRSRSACSTARRPMRCCSAIASVSNTSWDSNNAYRVCLRSLRCTNESCRSSSRRA